MSKLKKDDKIFIAGHNGMVGSAIERKFTQEGFKKIEEIWGSKKVKK